MKKAAGSIRIDLAQYREMEVFTQFSSDLDPETKEQLQFGKGLMEMLKQPLCNPLSLSHQVISLVVAENKLMLDVNVADIKTFQMDMLRYFDAKYPEIGKEIEEKEVLTDELKEKILTVAKEYKSKV